MTIWAGVGRAPASNAFLAALRASRRSVSTEVSLPRISWYSLAASMPMSCRTSGPRKLSSLQFTIKSFQRHFDRVVSIEDEGGYMKDVLDYKPYMEERIGQLARDHVRFRERLRKLITQLSEIKEWDEPRFEEVCEDLRSLIEAIDRHNEQEVELLQESMLVDDGGEG